jgi:hypothetical protein
LPKTILRSVRIPITSLHGVALGDIRTIDLLTNRVSHGSVFLSDFALVRTSLGTSGAISLPRLSTNDVTVNEGNSGTTVMRFQVKLSRAATRPVRVHIDAANNFFFGGEVVTPVSRTLVFQPGQTTYGIALKARGNTLDGPDLTFPVVLSVPTEAILDHSIGVGTVLDDDPTPTLRVAAGSATEHDGVMHFPLTASAATSNGIFVDAQLVNGTAMLGTDFGPESTAFGFIEPGLTTGAIDVPIIDDTVHESTETFSVHILDAFGAIVVGPSTVTGTIFDDD